MLLIDLRLHRKRRENAVKRCREKHITIPTFGQLRSPFFSPNEVKEKLEQTGLWDAVPENLFRITWKNEPASRGGLFRSTANFIELPQELTGVEARIVALVGKWFPTGSHKVGACFGCLVPRLVTGQFDPKTHKAVWPSTGNFCRGGTYIASVLGCGSVSVLPKEMSEERFLWLKEMGSEIIATVGSESNVKEIYDMVRELQRRRRDIFVFNQFSDFGNYLFHYYITGYAMEEVLKNGVGNGQYRGLCLATGSAGTVASGDYLKQVFPSSKIVVGEALQCPTLLYNGYGTHRIEGIGDKHVPWIHNVRNTDAVIGIDDSHVINLIRLFNTAAGQKYLIDCAGVPEELVRRLDTLGISSVANLLMAIKCAKYYELTSRDILLTVFTDSMELYKSRLQELQKRFGEYSEKDAARDFHKLLMGVKTDSMIELNHWDRKRIHNLKYFTWIEQQNYEVDELNRQWHDHENYWSENQKLMSRIDELITEFNQNVAQI